MKCLVALATLTSLLCAGGATAGVLKNGKLFYARASFGLGTQSLDDVNDLIEADEEIFLSAGIPVSFDTFDGAIDLGAEMGFRLAKTLSLGLSVNYQSNSLSNSYSDFTGFFEDDVELSVLDLSGNVTFWVPDIGIFLGGAAGYGLGNLEESVVFEIYGDPLSSYSISTEGDGSGFTASVFAGYQAVFTSGILVFGKVGYAYRNLGEFDGTSTSPEFGTDSGTFTDQAGRPVDFDFSGVYVLVGIGFSAGRIL